MKLNKCKKCGSSDIQIHARENSQYLHACCKNCGRTGSESLYFKDCGMDDMDDDEIAIENWNGENKGDIESSDVQPEKPWPRGETERESKLITQFNKLRPKEKWKLWKIQSGVWRCPACRDECKPLRSNPFHGCSVHCGECEHELSRRTGGGQLDPFKWILCET